MLYRFNSAAAGEIVMLAPHAEEVFAAINRPLGQRGVIAVAQLPEVIAALQQVMDRSKKQAEAEAGATENDDRRSAADMPVPFHTRALPLLNMLIKSQVAQKDVTWGL